MVIRAAFATDDGVRFIDRHFGDSRYFRIYEIDETGCRFIRQVKNSGDVEEKDVHADPVKARSVARVLMGEGVNTAVSRIFGPNIKRIRKKFVCVLMDDISIETAVELLRAHAAGIEVEWLKGESRKHLRIPS